MMRFCLFIWAKQLVEMVLLVGELAQNERTPNNVERICGNLYTLSNLQTIYIIETSLKIKRLSVYIAFRVLQLLLYEDIVDIWK